MTEYTDVSAGEEMIPFVAKKVTFLLKSFYPFDEAHFEILESQPQSDFFDLLKCLKNCGCEIIERKNRAPYLTTKAICEIICLSDQSYWIYHSHSQIDSPTAISLSSAELKTEMNDDFINQIQAVYEIYSPLILEPESSYPHLKENKHWFWSTLEPLYSVYGSVAVGTVFINIFALFSSVFSMNVYDRVVPNGAVETLYTLSFGMLILYSFDLAFKILRSRLLDAANLQIDIALSKQIFEHLLKVPLALKPKSLGGFSSLVTQFESFREFFASATLATLVDLPFMFLFIGMIAYMGHALVWTQLITVPLVAMITLGTQWLCQERVKKQQKTSSQKQTLLVESLYNLESIKFWGAEDVFQRRWALVLENSAQVHREIKSIQTVSSYLSQTVQSLAYVLMITYGVLMILEGSLTMGALIGCSILSSRALAPILQIGQLVLKWQQAKNSYQAMSQLVALPSESKKEGLSAHNIDGFFEYQSVTFRYSADHQPSLNQVNCQIRPGDKIGIVGPNGSGKSTFLKMMLGLYVPTEGQVRLDGFHLQQFNMSDLRQKIGYVPQEVQLISGTLKDNLLIGCRSVSQEHLIQVLKDSGIYQWISGHPKGLDMFIEERGQNLSGGQKQSIGLARALMSNPKILLLDEPTSSLDFQAENSFIESLERCLENRTLVVVSHRHAPLKLCKEILVFQNGQIVKRQELSMAPTSHAS